MNVLTGRKIVVSIDKDTIHAWMFAKDFLVCQCSNVALYKYNLKGKYVSFASEANPSKCTKSPIEISSSKNILTLFDLVDLGLMFQTAVHIGHWESHSKATSIC